MLRLAALIVPVIKWDGTVICGDYKLVVRLESFPALMVEESFAASTGGVKFT